MAVYLGNEMVNAFSGIPQSLNGENKTAITTALTNKGVTVPDDMDINDIATLIEAIEAGGGGIDYGTITTINPSSIKIEHGLGAVPQALIFIALVPEKVAVAYDDAPLCFLLPKKGEASSRFFLHRGIMQREQLSASDTNSLFGSGTSNNTYDRVNNINDSYFVTPTCIDACTYFWAVFKEALI